MNYAPGVPAEVAAPMVKALESLDAMLKSLRGPSRKGEREKLRMFAARMERELEAASCAVAAWGRTSEVGNASEGGGAGAGTHAHESGEICTQVGGGK